MKNKQPGLDDKALSSKLILFFSVTMLTTEQKYKIPRFVCLSFDYKCELSYELNKYKHKTRPYSLHGLSWTESIGLLQPLDQGNIF